MKKLLLGLTALLLSATASASFKALEFKASDGSVTTVRTNGLILTPNGEILDISNYEGEKLSIPLTSIDYMQFTEETSGIASVAFNLEGSVRAFSDSGLFEGDFSSAFEASSKLNQGIHILKNDTGKTIKIIVKK